MAIAKMNAVQTGYVEVMKNLMAGVSIFVSVILGALIIYATNFLIKKRKKEFGIYMMLGMGKWKISKILIIETLFCWSYFLNSWFIIRNIPFTRFISINCKNVFSGTISV